MSVDSAHWLHVVAAVISREDAVLLAMRPQGKHQGGKWEFPGGKVEAGESAQRALVRELYEELAIAVDPDCLESFLQVRHTYPDKAVFLDVWSVTAFSGEPQGCEGQQIGWFKSTQLQGMTFPDANLPILEKLARTLLKS